MRPSNFASRRSHSISLGYVPLTDCAPLAVAQEMGIFSKYGLDVVLHRELGWATVRDRLFYGDLDAAESIAGIAFALGFGLTDLRCEVAVPLILNLHGNAITLSTDLPWEAIGDGSGLKKYLERGWKKTRPFTLAATHRFSSHNVLLHTWIKRHGLSDTDIEIIFLPPQLMPRHLKSGHIDGYCVGEPYNSEAILGGYGWSPVTSSNLSYGHPEKVLLLAGEFLQNRKEDSIKLVAALIESCKICQDPDFREDLISILAEKKYTAASKEILRNSLNDTFYTGTANISASSFHMFHGDSVNRPSTDKASWMLAGLRSSGSLPDSSAGGSLSRLYREDIYMAANSGRA
ncbi:CmpA/NrtA family ABC transporter substrate-binding protein [Luteolibacter sp. AS25]|uniref:CmpA/NrtA family ABC transporter substrate-binding protein n=1 Tax=Luteolibacter sp. AS25 TaxID=3135776 RepID=UPI00398A54D9